MVVAVYFTNWSIYARGYKPDQIDHATHVIYAFLRPTEFGAIELSDPWADLDIPICGTKGCISALNQLKQQRGYRVMASIGGYTYSPQMGQIFTDVNKRREFVKSAANLVAQYNFDGLDIDWEYPANHTEGRVYVDLLRELRQALNSLVPGLQLTIAAPAGEHNLQYLPLSDLVALTDFINVMAYDFSGLWSSTAEHHTNLTGRVLSVNSVINYYTSHGVPPSKLVLGIPLYGRSFGGAKHIGDKFSGVLPGKFEDGVHDYNGLPLPNYREMVDHGCYCIGPGGLISYDNTKTVKQKAEYVKSQHLKGGMFWEASGDRGLIQLFAENYR